MAGLFGVGGGILFVPTLVALGLGQLEAQATSLLAILPTVAAGAWNQRRYGNLRVAAGARARRGLDRRRGGRGARSRRAAGGRTLRRLFAAAPVRGGGAARLADAPRARRATLNRRDPASPSRSPAPSGALDRARRGRAAAELAVTGVDRAPRSDHDPRPGLRHARWLEWPTSTTADVQSFQYPDDGSMVSLGRSRAVVSAQPGQAAAAQSFAEAIVLSLFGGEVVAARVTASTSAGASGARRARHSSRRRSRACARSDRTSRPPPGRRSRSRTGDRCPFWYWTPARERGTDPPRRDRSSRCACASPPTHGGLPAGSEIVVGSVAGDRSRAAGRGAASATGPGAEPTTPSGPTAPEPDAAGETVPGGPVLASPEVTAELSAGGYVFPIYGTVSFGDSFGAPRPNVQGGWHHGEDIFARAGAPLLAVADGTLHTIGFNKIGGYRLWLRDTPGTSSTTPISPPTRRSPSTARR